MSASVILLADDAAADVTFTLVSQTANGAFYKLVSRPLSEPLSLQFQYNIGAPGSKANDKLIVTVRDTKVNATTLEKCTGTIKVELSIPRDADALGADFAEDLMSYIGDLLSHATWRGEIADAIVPSTE